MTRSRALRLIPSILWVVGLLAGIGLFLRALRFVELQATDSYWGSLVWVVPVVLAVAWVAITVLWYRDTRRLMPLHMLVLITFPFVPIAVLGILLHPPFHTGMGVLTEISDNIHHIRGGRVLLGTIVALILYLHALIGGRMLSVWTGRTLVPDSSRRDGDVLAAKPIGGGTACRRPHASDDLYLNRLRRPSALLVGCRCLGSRPRVSAKDIRSRVCEFAR